MLLLYHAHTEPRRAQSLAISHQRSAFSYQLVISWVMAIEARTASMVKILEIVCSLAKTGINLIRDQISLDKEAEAVATRC